MWCCFRILLIALAGACCGCQYFAQDNPAAANASPEPSPTTDPPTRRPYRMPPPSAGTVAFAAANFQMHLPAGWKTSPNVPGATYLHESLWEQKSERGTSLRGSLHVSKLSLQGKNLDAIANAQLQLMRSADGVEVQAEPPKHLYLDAQCQAKYLRLQVDGKENASRLVYHYLFVQESESADYWSVTAMLVGQSADVELAAGSSLDKLLERSIKSFIAAPAAPPRGPGARLVIAAFDLDVAQVKSLLAEGVDPNARMGDYDWEFDDKWTNGRPMAADKWTPLIAVATSHREPQPAQPAVHTSEGLDLARAKRAAIDPRLIAERDQRRLEIAKLLLAAKCDLDLDDGYGATALYEAIYADYEELALLLIESGAKVNTKTGIYIDGAGDMTPLHRATEHPKIVQALIKHGATVNAKDSEGDTPLHFSALLKNLESVQLLLAAGADPSVEDHQGRKPSHWGDEAIAQELDAAERKRPR